MTMPYLAEDKLAAELMKARPSIPIILGTGSSDQVSDHTASAIGVRALAYKPVGQADLAQTVRAVLDEARNPGCGAVGRSQ